MKNVIVSLAALMLLACIDVQAKVDVCIYGGNASGCIAAIQAARMGKSTILVAPGGQIGGMITSGLTATDMNRHTAIGGVTAEFYGRIYDYYENPAVWRNQTRDEFMTSTRKRTFSGKNDKRRIQWVYEPKVGEQILRDMLSKEGVSIISGILAESKAVRLRGRSIRSIRLSDGSLIEAKMFIDASYTGDLMAAAGVSYTYGREGSEQYGESLAGIRINYNLTAWQDINPYSPRTGKLLPYIIPQPWGENGDSDKRIQSYCYRVTLTDDPSNMRPITRPAGYDPDLYEVVLGQILNNGVTELKKIITFTPMPNRKTDTNHLDFFGAADEYPEGSYAKRLEIEAAHRNYAMGMLWFLGHDERVPENLRNEMLRWGYAADEYVDNGNFPPQMYVRESRRMVGEYVMTQKNLNKENREPAPESVGLGTYPFDCHFVSTVISNGKLYREGTMFVSMPPYPISYRSLTPKRKECGNLLVTVCLSASHVAYASLRMEPQYMVLGQSAATAACIAIDSGKKVQDLDYNILKDRLLADGQKL